MSHSRVNPGWAANATLLSSEMNQVDINVSESVDKTSAGDTVSGPLTLQGAGRVIPSVTAGTDGDTTYTVGSTREIRITSAVTAPRSYTLSATGAATNDVITIWADTSAAQTITVLDQAAAALTTIGTANFDECRWAEFIFIAGWRVHMTSGSRSYTQVLTAASGSVTSPRWARYAIVTGCGGGGAGGDGRTGSLSSDFPARGGGGGAGAIERSVMYTISPSTSYNYVIGAGGVTAGSGGATPGNGGDGDASIFDGSSSAYFAGGFGGNGSELTDNTSGAVSFGGERVVIPTALRAQYDHIPGAGCGGPCGLAGGNIILSKTGGSTATYIGGSGGANGTTSASYAGGGGGGGGGAGAFGDGANGGAGGNGAFAGGVDGSAGSSASANTGAGGGGGGGGGSGATAGVGANGGDGGSGKIIITWLR